MNIVWGRIQVTTKLFTIEIQQDNAHWGGPAHPVSCQRVGYMYSSLYSVRLVSFNQH